VTVANINAPEGCIYSESRRNPFVFVNESSENLCGAGIGLRSLTEVDALPSQAFSIAIPVERTDFSGAFGPANRFAVNLGTMCERFRSTTHVAQLSRGRTTSIFFVAHWSVSQNDTEPATRPLPAIAAHIR
jgi:hypothetical protein